MSHSPCFPTHLTDTIFFQFFLCEEEDEEELPGAEVFTSVFDDVVTTTTVAPLIQVGGGGLIITHMPSQICPPHEHVGKCAARFFPGRGGGGAALHCQPLSHCC